MRHLGDGASDAISATLAVPADRWEQWEVQRACGHVFLHV